MVFFFLHRSITSIIFVYAWPLIDNILWLIQYVSYVVLDNSYLWIFEMIVYAKR